MSTAHHHRRSARGLLRARPRLYGSLAFGAITAAISPATLTLPARLLIGWDLSITLYLALAFVMMARSTQQAIRRRAIQHREGRWAILTAMTLAACASLVDR